MKLVLISIAVFGVCLGIAIHAHDTIFAVVFACALFGSLVEAWPAADRAEGAKGAEENGFARAGCAGDNRRGDEGMSEERAEYGAAERAEEITQRRGDAEERTLVTTIRWHRPAERMPAYGLTVVVWIETLEITVRAYRVIPGDMWRVAGTSANGFHTNLITAWTDVPNGPLPPPDGGEG